MPPQSFKAGKYRKSLDYISSVRTPLPRRMPSRVSPQLVGDSEDSAVMAGVARLLYRHLAEGQGGHAAFPPPIREDLDVVPGTPRRGDFSTAHLDEELFFRPHARFSFVCAGRRRFCCRRQRQDSSDAIFSLLQRVCGVGCFGTELVVLCAIYVERLLRLAPVCLSRENWRPIVLVALLVASKVFEDIHPWNADFAAVVHRALGLSLLQPSALYVLESRFLECLRWNASVSGEEYARYYFALRDASHTVSPRECSLGPGLTGTRRERAEHRSVSWCGVAEGQDKSLASTLLSWPEAGDEPAGRSPARRSQPAACSTASSSPDSVVEPMEPASSSSLIEGKSFRECCRGSAPVRVECEAAAFAHSSSASASLDATELGQQPGCPWWVDTRNPYIGTFRHAPRAEPPSRHIGEQVVRGRGTVGQEPLLYNAR